jgi:single-stranded DNA-specific DHH superfamily exonuclease
MGKPKSIQKPNRAHNKRHGTGETAEEEDKNWPFSAASKGPVHFFSRYLFCEFAGVGVAYKLCAALETIRFRNETEDMGTFLMSFLQWAALPAPAV